MNFKTIEQRLSNLLSRRFLTALAACIGFFAEGRTDAALVVAVAFILGQSVEDAIASYKG